MKGRMEGLGRKDGRKEERKDGRKEKKKKGKKKVTKERSKKGRKEGIGRKKEWRGKWAEGLIKE